MINAKEATWTPPDLKRFGEPVVFTDHNHTRNTSANGFFQHYTIGIGGLCSVYDPPVSYWCSSRTAGGNAFPFRTPTGVTVSDKALPHAPYASARQALISVWHPSRWENWMFEVASYDNATNNFTFGKGGNQGARGANTGGDFFVENVWEELDAAGEFFHDRESGRLYIIFNGTGAEPNISDRPDGLDVVAPQLHVLINASGTRWNPIHNVTIHGIKFTAAAPTFMMPHGIPSAGDWALERFGAIFLEGTVNAKIQRCTLERLDGHGVMVSGFNRNATVSFCNFAHIGGSGIAAWGYTNETSGDGHPAAGVDGTDGNHPRYTAVMHNLIREVGLYEKQNSFYVQAKAAQSQIIGNIFFNGPRAGINFNDGFGGGDEIAHNLVFSTCRESGDHGPLNMWDRQPFLTTVRTGEPSLIMADRIIHHNFFIDNYSPQEDVDTDDGSNNIRAHHNFLVYGNFGLKSDYGGHDNHHDHNIYAYIAVQALFLDTTLPGHQDQFTQNKVVSARPGRPYSNDLVGLPCSSKTYPDGSPVVQDQTLFEGNEFFTMDGYMHHCGAWAWDGNANTTVKSIPSDDTILDWGHQLLYTNLDFQWVRHDWRWPSAPPRQARRAWTPPSAATVGPAALATPLIALAALAFIGSTGCGFRCNMKQAASDPSSREAVVATCARDAEAPLVNGSASVGPDQLVATDHATSCDDKPFGGWTKLSEDQLDRLRDLKGKQYESERCDETQPALPLSPMSSGSRFFLGRLLGYGAGHSSSNRAAEQPALPAILAATPSGSQEGPAG
jgi:hypothetical protein